MRRTECQLSEDTPIGGGIHEINQKGWHDLCLHVRSILQALLEYYNMKDDPREGHRPSDPEPLAVLEEFDKNENPLYKLLGQPEQGYIRRFGDKLKPQPRNAVRDRINSMRIYLNWCSGICFGNGLLLESNGVPVSLPAHSDLALWPDQLLTIFYKALHICYQDRSMKLCEDMDTQNPTTGSSPVGSRLLHGFEESQAHKDSTTSRVDGTVLLEPPNSAVEVPIWIRLPQTVIENDQGSRLHGVLFVSRRTEQLQPLQEAQIAAQSQDESLKNTCKLQRDTLEQLHQNVQRLTLQVDCKEEDIKQAESARRQLAQERDDLKTEVATLRAGNKKLEAAWQDMFNSRHEERELRKTDLMRLAKFYESLQVSQNRNVILNSQVDRLEAQLKETEAAWSKAAQDCDLLEAEIERLRLDMGETVPLDRLQTGEGFLQQFPGRRPAANRPPLRNTGFEELSNGFCDGWDNSQTDIRDG